MKQRFVKNQGTSPERERLNYLEVQACKDGHVIITFPACYDKTEMVKYFEGRIGVRPTGWQYIGKE